MDAIWETHLILRGKPSAAREEYLVKGKIAGTPSLPPGAPVPPVLPPVPPSPTEMRIAEASSAAAGIYYDVPPASVEISWAITNPEVGHTISIDRRINAENWQEDVVTSLALGSSPFTDTIDDFVNRPNTDQPPITHRVTHRVRVVNGSSVTVLSRTTAAIPLHPV
jgi:hypothetical protein